MIAAIVGTIVVIVLFLVTGWLLSPGFRKWSEQPKFGMLERNARFDGIRPRNQSRPASTESFEHFNEVPNRGAQDENVR